MRANLLVVLLSKQYLYDEKNTILNQMFDCL